MSDLVTPVYINGRRIGSFSRIRDNRLGFEYDEGWRQDPSAYPISLSMPLAASGYADRGRTNTVGNYLWGLLPDNERTLTRWARHFEVGRGNPLRLLRHVGADCPGALAFVAPAGSGDVRVLDDDDLVNEVRLLQEESDRSVLGGEVGHFSLAGAQAKTALRRVGDRWALPSGDEPSTHILKPAMAGLQAQALNEHFCLSLARHAGIAAAKSEVRNFGDIQAVIVERFDRVQTEHGVRRVHQEDLCQALSVHPDNKYERDGGPGIRAITRVLAEYSSEPERDRRRFMEAVAFNWLIAGTDAHAKNFSLLHGNGGRVRLAPLYDLNSVWPYYGRRGELRSSLRIGGHYRIDEILPRHFLREAAAAGLAEEAARGLLSGLVEKLPDLAATVAADLRDKGLEDPIHARMIDGIRRQCRTLSKR